MPIKHVASASLNLRSEPLAKPSTLIVSLPFGHTVEVQGASPREGWVNVRTIYNGRSLAGVTDGSLLREPLSTKKESLLASAAIEWDRFKRGAGKEDRAPYFRYIGEMWKRRGQNLDGKNTSQRRIFGASGCRNTSLRSGISCAASAPAPRSISTTPPSMMLTRAIRTSSWPSDPTTWTPLVVTSAIASPLPAMD